MNILRYKDYLGHFEYDQDDDIFYGNVSHTNDVVTFQGRSIDELKQSLADAVEGYLTSCLESGKQPRKNFSGRINLRISPELHAKIAYLAEKEGMSINRWIISKLEQSL